MYYKIACIYFGAENHAKCIEYLQFIIDDKSLRVHQDLMCFSRVLNVVAHYDAGLDYEIEKQVKQTYKFLLKMDELQSVQKELIRFLRSLTATRAAPSRAGSCARRSRRSGCSSRRSRPSPCFRNMTRTARDRSTTTSSPISSRGCALPRYCRCCRLAARAPRRRRHRVSRRLAGSGCKGAEGIFHMTRERAV